MYPGEQKNLHIFEPRYKEMITDCLSKNTPFVVVRSNDVKTEEIGCAVQIEKVLAQYPDGRMDIAVEGICRARIIRIDRTESYQQGIVEKYSDTTEFTHMPQREQLIAQHIKLLEIAGRTVSPQYYDSIHPISWLIGRNCGLSLDQRQDLLEMRSEDKRIRVLVEYLEEFIPEVIEQWEVRMRIMSNGHFKDFPS